VSAMERSRDLKGGGEDNEKKRNREEHKARSRQWNTVGSDDDENDQDDRKHRRHDSHSGRRDSGSVKSASYL
jgi:hypothetical protein